MLNPKAIFTFVESRVNSVKAIKSTNPIAVGDKYFLLSILIVKKTGVITDIEVRQNYIVRKSVNLSKQIQIIAANIDQVFLMITLKTPPTFPAFIDRFLVTAKAYEIKTVLLFNKIDQYNSHELIEMRSLKEVYEKIGYDCHEVVATDINTLGKIQNIMAEKVSMFSGHSGVGKSTLINTLSPSLDLKTANIFVQHEQGQHTTTYAEMFDLEGGAKLIDTPGIRGLGYLTFERKNYQVTLLNFQHWIRNVNLTTVCISMSLNVQLKALGKGEIAYSRYKSYLQLLEDDILYR